MQKVVKGNKKALTVEIVNIIMSIVVEKVNKSRPRQSIARVSRYFVPRKLIIAWLVNFCNYFLGRSEKMLTLFAAANIKKTIGGVKMLEEWTGDLVKKMHLNRVSNTELAEEMGVSKNYVGMLINGVRDANKHRERMEEALNAIVARKAAAD